MSELVSGVIVQGDWTPWPPLCGQVQVTRLWAPSLTAAFCYLSFGL